MFDDADFYDAAEDTEVLEHRELGDALEDAIDCAWSPGMTDEEVLDDVCPVTVYAFKRKTVQPGFAESVVSSWLETFDENHWGESYGRFDDYNEDIWKDEQALKKELTEVLARHLKTASVWQCEKAAERVFSKAEVIKITGIGK